MGSASIGEAALVLTTNAAGARAGLNEFGRDAAATADKTEKTMGGTFDKIEARSKKTFGKLAKKGGFLAGVGADVLGGLGLGGYAAGIAALVIGAQQAAKVIDSLLGYSRDLNKELERGARLADQAAKSMARFRSRDLEWVGAEVSTNAKADRVSVQIEKMHTELAGLIVVQQSAEKEWKKLNTASAEGTTDWLFGFKETHLAAGKKTLDEAVAATAAARDHLNALQEQQQRILNPLRDPAIIGQFNRTVKDLKDAMATANLTEGGKLAFPFAEKKLPATMLGQLRRLGDEKAAFDKRFEANKGFEAFLADLNTSVVTVGMSADQVKLFKAALDGVDAGKIAEARRLIQARAALTAKTFRTEFKNNAPLELGTSAEVTARLSHQFGLKDVGEKQLDQAIKAAQLLGDIKVGIKALAGRFGAAELLPF